MKTKSIHEIVRQHYTKIKDQCFSEDGAYAVAIDTFGRFYVFSVFKINQSSITSFTDTSFSPRCLNTLTNNLLVCGDSKGQLNFYQWDSLKESKINKNLKLSTIKFVNNKINDILSFPNSGTSQKVAIACNNGSIHLCDIELKINLHSYHGHLEQVNQLAARTKKTSNSFSNSENEFASCSNDGRIYLWDIRIAKKAVRTLNISDPVKGVVRSKFSKGIYAMDLEDDFVVCGGGVELSLWHFGTENLICKLKSKPTFKTDNILEDDIIYEAVQSFNGQIIAGGRSNNPQWNGSQLHRFNFIGEHIHCLKFGGINMISSILTYISSNCYKAPNLTLIGGDSSKIFCLSELGYLSHSINTSNGNFV